MRLNTANFTIKGACLLLILFGTANDSAAQDSNSAETTVASESSPIEAEQVDAVAAKADATATKAEEVDAAAADSAEPSSGDSEDSDPLAGHSFHGEAFNEGPRQAAYLMPGLGHVDFKATTTDDVARRFIDQGIAQLHGFWYYEAERSFRQAAVCDPDCAIAYWGMAMANVENRKRAREFIAQAVERKESASDREQRYIEAYEKLCRDEDEKGKTSDKKSRAETYSRDLEEIVADFPGDVEARAFLALQLWQNERAGLPIISHVAIDSVLQDVFDANPMHPAHHYRIHLWDRRKPERAVASAARCGQSLPAIAHMWHMPGHIYSKLHRYQDAVWQQEASARVDHAHMMRDRVLPDQIHNFAHNNEWLIRNLLKIGRIEDAISLAKNMLELPRHPKLNTIEKGSTKYGRERLLLSLTTYRLWDELIALSNTMYLEPTSDERLQDERTRDLGIALALTNKPKKSRRQLRTLEDRLKQTLDAKSALEPSETTLPESPESPEIAESAEAVEVAEANVAEANAAQPAEVTSKVEDVAEAVEATSKVEEVADSVESTVEAEVVADAVEAVDATANAANAADAVEDTAAEKPDSNQPRQTEQEQSVAAESQKTLTTEDTEEYDSPQKKVTEDATEKKSDSEQEKETKDSGELKKLKATETRLKKAIASVKAARAAAKQNWQTALELWKESDLSDNLLKAEWTAAGGDAEAALKLVEKEIEKNPEEVPSWAVKTWLQMSYQRSEAANCSFETLQKLACVADLETPLLSRLKPLATELGLSADWASEYQPAEDIGTRPELDSLGPFRWHPYSASNFKVQKVSGETVGLKELGGKPKLVIFYLGFGCLHCVEQLQAFSPRADQFRELGIDVLAISSEDTDALQTAIANYTEPLNIPLHADPELNAFKSYRCFDDFEQQPLHGTFLIDPQGLVLWQDISYEPFMDVDFVLAESRRLAITSKNLEN